jgi:hypothetical protein
MRIARAVDRPRSWFLDDQDARVSSVSDCPLKWSTLTIVYQTDVLACFAITHSVDYSVNGISTTSHSNDATCGAWRASDDHGRHNGGTSPLGCNDDSLQSLQCSAEQMQPSFLVQYRSQTQVEARLFQPLSLCCHSQRQITRSSNVCLRMHATAERNAVVVVHDLS